jgi:hypothetical protein
MLAPLKVPPAYDLKRLTATIEALSRIRAPSG